MPINKDRRNLTQRLRRRRNRERDREKRRLDHKNWRDKNKEHLVMKDRKRAPHIYKKKRDFMWMFKDCPCTDCGVRYPPWVMDFDHVRGEKKYNVALMFRQSLETILTEIEKCEVVCSNCHRERTHKRRVAGV